MLPGEIKSFHVQELYFSTGRLSDFLTVVCRNLLHVRNVVGEEKPNILFYNGKLNAISWHNNCSVLTNN